eukprot:gnl/Trimastix_PCT/1415.p1 GENE.gnl/Trimastix_PCT/1415~~gnl/Trimastix_PCT/1415.p1  ORF type:complete len:1102 (+),score=322.27 gnl/Trimastix_PCT/1415:81-3386(+)
MQSFGLVGAKTLKFEVEAFSMSLQEPLNPSEGIEPLNSELSPSANRQTRAHFLRIWAGLIISLCVGALALLLVFILFATRHGYNALHPHAQHVHVHSNATFVAAAIQYSPQYRSSATPTPAATIVANLDSIDKLIGQAAKAGAQLVVLPEAMTGWRRGHLRSKLVEFAELVPQVSNGHPHVNPSHESRDAYHDRPQLRRLSEMARTHRVVLVGNMLTRVPCAWGVDTACPADGQRVFSTAVAFAPWGQLLATRHHAHKTQTPFLDEMTDAQAAAQLPYFDAPWGVRVGLLLSGDLHHRRPSGALARLGITHAALVTGLDNIAPSLYQLQLQQGFSWWRDLALIAANHDRSAAHRGGGIFLRGEPLAAHYSADQEAGATVLTARVPCVLPVPSRPARPLEGIRLADPLATPEGTETCFADIAHSWAAAVPCHTFDPSQSAGQRVNVTVRNKHLTCTFDLDATSVVGERWAAYALVMPFADQLATPDPVQLEMCGVARVSTGTPTLQLFTSEGAAPSKTRFSRFVVQGTGFLQPPHLFPVYRGPGGAAVSMNDFRAGPLPLQPGWVMFTTPDHTPRLTESIALANVLPFDPSGASYVASAVQYHAFADLTRPIRETIRRNLARAPGLVAEAKRKGAQLVVFPEGTNGWMAFTGQWSRATAQQFAEHIPDVRNGVPYVNPSEGLGFDEAVTTHSQLRFWSQLARRYGIVLVTNLLDYKPCSLADAHCPADGHYLFNALAVLSETGQLLAVYHKEHISGSGPVLDQPRPGDQPTMFFDTSFGVRFGAIVCADINYVEPALTYRKLGVRNLIFSTNFGSIPPIAMSLGLEGGFSRYMDTNLIASNNDEHMYRRGGSLLTLGDPRAQYFHPSMQAGRGFVLTARMPKIPPPLERAQGPFVPAKPLPAVSGTRPSMETCFMLSPAGEIPIPCRPILGTPNHGEAFTLAADGVTFNCTFSYHIDAASLGPTERFVAYLLDFPLRTPGTPDPFRFQFCGVARATQAGGQHRIAVDFETKTIFDELSVVGSDFATSPKGGGSSVVYPILLRHDGLLPPARSLAFQRLPLPQGAQATPGKWSWAMQTTKEHRNLSPIDRSFFGATLVNLVQF